MAVKMKAGVDYRRRDGERVYGIRRRVNYAGSYPWEDRNGATYTNEGFYAYPAESPRDLIEEWGSDVDLTTLACPPMLLDEQHGPLGDGSMTYWTVMLITVLSGYLDGAQIYIPYPTWDDCEKAVPAVTATLPYDFSVVCKQSSTVSTSMRPRKSPMKGS